jgi:hypothetical protein
MDCEVVKADTTSYANKMSSSGPYDYRESRHAIEGYTRIVKEYGFLTTIFIHPEVAEAQPELFLKLKKVGNCLGLHLHPYKLEGGEYKYDLGAYSYDGQTKIIESAIEVWEKALGYKPLYFRAGYFSANDNTFRVLKKLGFKGGSLSIPGRVLPEHYSLWSGSEPSPHRANLNFRQQKGDSDFIEVPMSVDLKRPLSKGEAGEKGYEWLYVPSRRYDHKDIVKNILKRCKSNSSEHHTIGTDTHNDQDYSNPEHPSTKNLKIILNTLTSLSKEMGIKPTGSTLESIYNSVLDN